MLGVLLAGTPGSAAADGLQTAFTDKVGAAMKHVRLAQFYLRTGNLAVAGAELDQATENWAAVTAAFGAKPPGKLAGDSGFGADLTAIGGALDAALAAVDDGRAGCGRRAAEAGRGPPRRAAQAQRPVDFQRLHRRHEPGDGRRLGLPPQAAGLRRPRAGRRDGRAPSPALQHWYKRCYREAGPRERANPAFKRLFPGSLESVARLLRAARDRSALRVVNNLRELRSFDRLIWLYLG